MHSDTGYPDGSRVLEAGCGVGAQTRVLAASSPGAQITSVDISKESLDAAEQMIRDEGFRNVTFGYADIMELPFDRESFDHVFVCFTLEHLTDPLAALRNLHGLLKPGGTITAIEGDHGSCFWHPHTGESQEVWEAFIVVQQELGHDPLIGRRLCPLVASAGFSVTHSSPRYVYGDLHHSELLDGMVNKIIVPMVQTGKVSALEAGFVPEEVWNRGVADLEITGVPPEGTFFYTWFKAVGEKV